MREKESEWERMNELILQERFLFPQMIQFFIIVVGGGAFFDCDNVTCFPLHKQI